MTPSVATIGFFDGVHLGHRFLIGQVVDEARRRGMRSLAVTFDRHPRQVLHQDYQPQLLTTLDDKRRLLRATGVDDVVALHFDLRLASLSAREFMEQVLLRRLGVRCLVIGHDNRFGHNRAEGFADYVRYGRELGIDVVQATAFMLDGQPVSSSRVRRLLAAGDIAGANRCLGRPYELQGVVVHGFREGRRLGFPTANIDVAAGLLVPKGGVYAAQTSHGPAMMDIGTRPTFGGTRQSVEVNIFGFSGDLYGQTLRVSLVSRLRDERRFGSPEELARQLREDRRHAIEVLGSHANEDVSKT